MAFRKKREKRIRAVDCVDYGLTFFAREYKRLLPFLLAFHIPFVFLGKLLASRVVFLSILADMGETYMAGIGSLLMLLAGELLMGVFAAFLQVLVSGAVIHSAYRLTVFGDRPTFSDGFRRGIRLFLMRLILAGIAYGASYAVSMVITIVFSVSTQMVDLDAFFSSPVVWILLAVFGVSLAVFVVYVLLRFGYFPQFVVIENRSVFRALKSSWKATKGRAWHILCVFLISQLLSSAIMTAVTALDGLMLLPAVQESGWAVALVSALLTSVTMIASYVGDAAFTFSYLERMDGRNGTRQYEFALQRFFQERNV